MRYLICLSVVTAAIGMASAVWAEEGAANPAGLGREEIKQRLLQKYDTNGDGNLTGDELQKARADLGKNLGGLPGPAGAAFDEIKKKFDVDGDGELNAQEQAAAMTAFQKARGAGGPGAAGVGAAGGGAGGFSGGATGGAEGEGGKTRGRAAMIKQFDKDGDGKLNEEEKAAAQKALKERLGKGKGKAKGDGDVKGALLKKFDADGDGKLSDEEKAAARDEAEEKRGAGRPEKKPE